MDSRDKIGRAKRAVRNDSDLDARAFERADVVALTLAIRNVSIRARKTPLEIEIHDYTRAARFYAYQPLLILYDITRIYLHQILRTIRARDTSAFILSNRV